MPIDNVALPLGIAASVPLSMPINSADLSFESRSVPDEAPISIDEVALRSGIAAALPSFVPIKSPVVGSADQQPDPKPAINCCSLPRDGVRMVFPVTLPNDTIQDVVRKRSRHPSPQVLTANVPGQLKGLLVSECLCIELCAGSANFSSALRDCGFQVLPVDHKNNRHHAKVTCTKIDLSHPSAFSILKTVVDNSNTVFVHAAPPCGTATRARDRPIPLYLQAQGAPNPKQLRSESFPAGVPGLGGDDLARVMASNCIYDTINDMVLYLLFRNILLAVENPRKSYYWLYGKMPKIKANPALEFNEFQHCMHGGTRDKWSAWLASAGLFTSLRLVCDKKHAHQPWGFIPGSNWEFATAQEAEYPMQLCRTAASLVLTKCIEQGMQPQAEELTDQLSADQTRQLTRARLSKQPRGKKLPPLISEFKAVTECSRPPEESDKSAKLLRQFQRGIIGEQEPAQVFVVGQYHSQDEFLGKAKECTHPIDSMRAVPDVTALALFNILTKGPVRISKERLETIRTIKNLKESLSEREAKLHSQMDPQVKEVLKGKNLLLLAKLIELCEYPDTSLARDIAAGFDLTGVTKKSGDLQSRIISATSTTTDLKNRSTVIRDIIAQQCSPSSDPGIDSEVYRQTLEEVSKGWLKGPYTASELDELLGKQWIPSRRFGIRQSKKVRAIDDASEPGINDALTTTEKLNLMGLDHLSNLLRLIMDSTDQDGKVSIQLADGSFLEGKIHDDWLSPQGPMNWLGRTLDLKSAYKQLAIGPESKWCSPLCVLNPSTSRCEFFVSSALLFGATSSVYAFNRCARAIWFVASKMLNMTAGQFYDDFPCLEPARSSAVSRLAFHALLHELGWEWSSGEKDRPFEIAFSALGVEFDLTGISDGAVSIRNKPDRVLSIEQRVLDIVGAGSLKRSEASELHGRLQFAIAQVFGRSLLPALSVLSRHASKSWVQWNLLKTTLLESVETLKKSEPRTLMRHSKSRGNLLIFSDGAWDGEQATWGLFIHDCETGDTHVDGGSVPSELINFWKSVVGEQLIGQIELWPILLSKNSLAQSWRGRKIIWFIDNESAKESLVRGFSDSPASAGIVQTYYDIESKHPTFTWFARVPSYSNPADEPSRGGVDETINRYGAKRIMLRSFSHNQVSALVSKSEQYLIQSRPSA